MAAYFNLQTNVPVVCTVNKIELAPGRGNWEDGTPKQDQITVAGDYEPGGPSKIFLHMSMEVELQKLGIIGQREGNTYQLLQPGAKVRFIKREDGKKRFTTAEIVGQGTVTPQTYQPQSQTGRPATQPVGKKELWDKTIYTMELCVKEAVSIWKKSGCNTYSAQECFGYTPEQVAATAHSLFIQMAKADLFRSPPGPVAGISPTQLELIANLCQRLNMEDATLTKMIVERFKCQLPNQLTEAQATALVGDLQGQVAANIVNQGQEESRF